MPKGETYNFYGGDARDIEIKASWRPWGIYKVVN